SVTLKQLTSADNPNIPDSPRHPLGVQVQTLILRRNGFLLDGASPNPVNVRIGTLLDITGLTVAVHNLDSTFTNGTFSGGGLTFSANSAQLLPGTGNVTARIEDGLTFDVGLTDGTFTLDANKLTASLGHIINVKAEPGPGPSRTPAVHFHYD